MPRKSSQAKQLRSIELIQKGTPYREIQVILKKEFGTGLSNSTLKKLMEQSTIVAQLKTNNTRLEAEVKVWKSLYFELKETMEKTSNQIKGEERDKK